MKNYARIDINCDLERVLEFTNSARMRESIPSLLLAKSPADSTPVILK
jgi:hypothetical protein